MSELKVELIRIDKIKPHPNAARMELVFVGGYQVCVRKDTFKSGDKAVYIPVDSVLNEDLESMIFGPDSKVKLHNHRVRCIKLRGAISEGMLLTWKLACQYIDKYNFASCLQIPNAKVGNDLINILGITKYQPPTKGANSMSGKCTPKKHHHPNFKKYTDINHLKKYVNAFEDGEQVWVTEKIHGTNFRAGWVKSIPRTFFQKLKNIFGLNQKYEFVYGSHNVQLMDGSEKTKYAFKSNIYKRCVEQFDLKNKIPFDEVWYGEIAGHGLQKNYDYGFGEFGFGVWFMDIMNAGTGKYYDFSFVITSCIYTELNVVPNTLAPYNLDEIKKRLNNPQLYSVLDHKTQPVEGFVVRSMKESTFYGGRRVLKILSDEYLMNKDNTDFH